MGVIFAISRQTKDNTRTNKTKVAQNVETRQNYLGKFIDTLTNRFLSLPRIVQLFILYFGLGVLAGIGGIMFSYSEYYTEEERLAERNIVRDDIDRLFEEDEIDDVLNWRKAIQQYNDNNKWELRYAAFFAATTFTTTGFGLQAPKTNAGKIMVFIYGLPAIIFYGVVAKKIGLLCIYFIKRASTIFMSEEEWIRKKLLIIGLICLTGFLLLAKLVAATSTEEGFGQGIDENYWTSIYFLWTTTSTIGYGDVMMSGSHPILTGLIGIWLATTCGLLICFCTELGSAALNSQKINVSIDPKQANHIINIMESEKNCNSNDSSVDQ